MALDYGSVKDMYDTLYDAGVTTKSLPEWSQEMNDLTGTELYTAGLHDNWIKRASHGIDKLLESTGLPGYSEQFGRSVGGLVGAPEAGAEVGHGLPRSVVNFAPLLIPGGGWLGGAAKLGLTGALSGAETYEKSDSPLAALISGATASALPGIAGKTSEAVGKVLSKSIGVPSVAGPIADLEGNIIKQVSEYFPQTAAQKVIIKGGSELAGQAAAAGAMGVSQPLEQLAQGEEPSSPFTVENLLGLTLGQAPFAALHLGGKALGRGEKPAALRQSELEDIIKTSQERIAVRQAKNTLENKTGVEGVPDVPQTPAENLTPDQYETARQTRLLLSQVRGEMVKVKDDATLTDEQKVEKYNQLMQQDYELQQKQAVESGLTLLGDELSSDTPRQEVIGNQLRINKSGTWRAIRVSDDPQNPEELRGKVVAYSTKGETPPKFGFQSQETGIARYNLPPEQWRTVKTLDEWNARFKKNDAGQPELPVQNAPMTQEELNTYLHDLDSVQTEVEGANTTGELQKATVKLNEVEADNGLPETNDARLKSDTQKLVDAGFKPDEAVKAAVKARANRVRRQVEATGQSQRELERAAPLPTPQEAAQISAQFGAGEEGANKGFSIITADKLSHASHEEDTIDTQPLKDTLTDAAVTAGQSPNAVRAFEGWSGKEDTTYHQDFADFLDLIGQYGSLSKVPLKEAGKFLADRTGAVPWDAAEVKEFIDRPHVQEWAKGLDAELAKQQETNGAFVPNKIVRPAGNRFLFSMAPYDPTTNRLGGKHTLPRDSVVDEKVFQNIGGIGKPLNKAEIELYKQLVPNAFQDGKVNVKTLDEGLKKSGPVVETRLLKTTEHSKARDERIQLQHNIETLGYEPEYNTMHDQIEVFSKTQTTPYGDPMPILPPDFVDATMEPNRDYIPLESLPQEHQDVINRWLQLSGEEMYGEGPTRGEARYSSIAPKDFTQMPGYVEGLVRLPVKREGKFQVPKDESIKFHGPHFGSSDQNVLAFYRGYEETLPNGEKAFHVIEVQSDWGQRTREQQQTRKERIAKIGVEPREDYWVVKTADDGLLDYDTKEQAQKAADKLIAQESEARPEQGHPLLSVYNELALKAAIQHAKDIGATKVILSDAETAMMTEGHDRAAITRYKPGEYTNESTRGYLVRKQSDNQVEATTGKFRIEPLDDVRGAQTFEVELTDGSWEKLTLSRTQKFRRAGGDEASYRGADEIFGKVVPIEHQVNQEGGMRFNYDQKLPSAMEKLTGGKGEVVDLGPHKQAVDFNTPVVADAETFQRPLKGSPVFKTPEGTPKTNITGRMYDISGVPSELTLTEPNRAPGTVGRANAPIWVPNEQRDIDTIDQMGINRGGKGMLEYLAQSKNPFFSSLAKDLAKFGASLARITGSMRNVDAGAFTMRRGGFNYELSFSPSVLRADDFTKSYYVAHELIHGLSIAELDNPTNAKIKTELDGLRQRVVDSLPKKMRKAYDDAVASDWYGRTARGETAEPFAPNLTQSERSILYGLFNEHEFLAQGISSRDMQTYMQGIKTEGQSWFSRFSNLVKTLLRIGEKVDGNAFAEFLSKTDQLLDRGNYVSSFRNFSDRYFENLGMSRDYVNSNTQRAMSILLNDFSSMSPDYALAVLRQGAGLRSNEWAKAERDVQRMFNERGEDSVNTQKVLDETGHRADRTGLLDLADSLALGDAPMDALDVLPEPAARFVFETAKDIQNIFGAIRAAAQERNAGILNIANPDLVHSVSKEVLRGIDKVVEQNRLHDMQVRDLQNLFTMAPNGFNDRLMASPESVPEEFTGESKKTWGDKISRFIEPIGQIARRIPEAAEAFSRGWQLSANQRKMLSESMKVFGMDMNTRELTKETVRNFARALKEPKLVKAANDWIYENQLAGEKSGETRVIDAEDSRIDKILSSLNPKDRDIVEDIVNKHQISVQHMQEQILEKRLQIASTNGAVIAQRLMGGKLKDSVALAEQLLNAFTANRQDPSAATLADAQIQQVRNKMTPDAFLELARFTKNAAEVWSAQKELFNKNPAWSSAQRYGKFIVEFRKGGKAYVAGVDSRKEAESLAEGRPFKLTKNQQYDEDRPPILGPDAVGIANRLRELEQNQIDILRSSGAFSPDQIAEIQRYSPSEQFVTEETYRGGVPGLSPQPRRLSKGAEELPWLRNHFSWVSKTANYWSRQLLRAQARAHLLDPEIAQNEQLSRDLQTHYENILQPDSQTGRLAQRAAMTWFMGFNPASAMVNATQPFLTHVAELTSLTGKPLDSYRRVLSALKEVYRTGLGKREWADPEIANLIHKASQDGELDYSMYDDQAAAQESIHTNYKRILSGNQVQTLGQRLSTIAGNFSNASMMLFRTVERINNMTALISSYKYYRESEPNLSPDAAYAKAVEFNHAVNYGGGRAQRPIGVFSGRGAFPRTAAMLATAMQSYNLGTAFQIARYIRSGFFRPEGLTPAEIHSARTAVVQMLGTQLVAAGVVGLPFVSGMLAVLNQAFPGLEVNRRLRETIAALTGGDADNGHILNDIAMSGAPSMLGWDLQSRLSMGNTVPGVSEINGFQPENLFGAPANLVANFVRGSYKLASGDPHGIDDFMPSALKKLEQLLRSGGQVLDYRDRPIFTPTVGEKVGIALGFNPKRLTDFNNASRIAIQADDNIKRREGDFHQTMAEQVLKGNFGTVRQALLQRAREDSKYDPRDAVRAIAGAAEELTFPRDLRREGTARSSDVRSKLLESFNIPPNQVSETDRLKFRQSVQQRLGLMTETPTGLQTAELMDQLRAQNPSASRAELRRQASLLLHGRRLQTLALPPE